MPNTKPKRTRPLIVGVVGGIASGKSFICQQLAARGGEVIDADRLGHEVLMVAEVQEKLIKSFGPTILDDAGKIDRSKLSRLVFGNPEVADSKRKELELIVHPQIRRMAEQKITQLQSRQTPPPAIILDAPLLLEAKWDEMCDAVIFVEVPVEIRKARAMERGWSEVHFVDREKSQMPLVEKRSRATHVIDNGPGADVARQIEVLWNELTQK